MEILAWKHRKDNVVMLVETSREDVTPKPRVTVIPRMEWLNDCPPFNSGEFHADKDYVVLVHCNHVEAEKWPNVVIAQKYTFDALWLDHIVKFRDYAHADTFEKRVASFSNVIEYQMAHPELYLSDNPPPKVEECRVVICRVVIRGLHNPCALHLNDTIGLLQPFDPKAPQGRRIIEVAEGLRSISLHNIEPFDPGTDRVILRGLVGAEAHLNGKRGLLLRLKSSSLEQVIVRLDENNGGGREVAVKFANYRRVEAEN